ncbi:YicC/YloC family endoribonuclease [Gracilibacillus sp. YIM 98692]|uniref:YicC/YloC family endoribonuclease n=1 Tax=Gracilibacillus sp. YIM 98692 TaxID=2663532 RepID=UPI001F088FC5|nr:YicC/YloC family endoribonuclease [Gracilibacillus sp. YIM 98692]
MKMYSMTGYGKAELIDGDRKIQTEIRTVNHRYFDISCHIPHYFLHIEDAIRKLVHSHLKRGRVMVSVHIDGVSLTEKSLSTDWNMVDQYLKSLQSIQDRYDLKGNLNVDVLARLPEIFEVKEEADIESELDDKVLQAVSEAVEKVKQMRKIEGKALKADLLNRANFIENKLKQLGERRKIVIIEYQERIQERIDSYLANSSVYDESKLMQEIALLAEKGDISEEITRLESHLRQFKQIIDEEDVIGRKLDFIVQEVHRELNTIGSKSNDTWISEQIIHLKSEVEKAKEQIQNVE